MDEQDLGLAEAEVVVPQDELSLQVQHRFQEFLESFSLADLLDSQSNNDDDDDDLGEDSSTLLYEQQALCMIGNENSTLYVDLSHVLRKDNVLAEAILGDYYRHSSYLNKAVQAFVQKVSPDSDATAAGGLPSTSDSTKKEYFVSFYGVPTIDRIRQLKTDKIGKLTAICGTVTRTSEVRPELLFGKFECLKCGRIIEDVEQQFKFTEPMICPTEGCKNQSRFLHLHQEGKFVDWQKLRVQENANEVPAGSMPRTLEVIVRHEAVERAKPGDKCIFTGMLIAIPDVAKLKTPSDGPGLLRAPRGRRTKEENGQGVTGIKALGVREMSYKLAFLACGIQSINARFANVHVAGGQNLSRRQLLVRMLQMQHKSNAGESVEEESAESIREQYTAEDLAELSLMARQPNLLAKMRRSIAPSVHGHDDIKLGVLLMLFGGVHKRTSDGIKLRGDINVCIVGDPSTAKSQFLKYVCSFLPRAIYTSGKASSAAGLTASVIKDAETGEYTIEAGALMLADNGICCIDEFDKMDDVDQVAIHEAMEQQTISITKAGIQATLNARTSILAAANPINGRYDRSKTLRANVNLSAPIMSRFDLFFVVVDECEESQDRIIAEHIIRVHRRRIQLLVQNRNPEEIDDFDAFPTEEDPADENNNSNNPSTSTLTGQSQAEQRHQHIFTTSQLQSYIKYARTIDPIIPPEVQPMLVECYRKLRQGDAVGGNRTAYRITVRQLEALIRLAEALARLHLDDHIRPRYVEWAYKLLKTSIVQVESGNIRFEDPGEDARPGSALIRTMEVDDIDEDAGDSDAEADNMGNNNGINNDDRRRGPRVEWDGPPVGEEDMDESDSSMSGVDAESTSEEVADSARPVKSKKGQQRQQKRGADTLQISYDEYMRVGNLLASFLRRKEEEAGSGRAIPVAQRELVLFYLNQREDISSEEELVIARRLINQIIDRLISKDSILMQVSKPEEPQEADIESDEGDDDDDMFPDEKRYLIVHPNYDPTFH